ncbi:MAG: hypothetical protein LRY55_14875 [Leadbetterella sp.]|nr:hypothetical protein [Leadbetterella sp.]
MNWKKANTITGPTAEGSKYFKRDKVERRIWRKIMDNHHILFLAPRRVGKSSIVIEMARTAPEGYVCIWKNIQSDNSLQDFYERMYDMIWECLDVFSKGKRSLTEFLKTIKITKISTSGVSIGRAEIDCRKEFFDLLEKVKESDVKVVLFLDEFPDVVWNVFKSEGSESAEKLLADIRSLDDAKFKKNFILVLLGSIGLSHIVKKITGREDRINNLHKEYLQALSKEEAGAFLKQITLEASMQIDEQAEEHLLSKLGHYLPYFIQLLVEECDNLLEEDENPHLDVDTIDRAYIRLLQKNERFTDWDSRLSKYFERKYPFLLEVLKECAHQNTLNIQQIFDISKKHHNESDFKKDLDDILVADGYIFEEGREYRFNSPLLRDWWKNRHPKLDEL